MCCSPFGGMLSLITCCPDDTFINVPAWDRMDMVVKSWLYGTISLELQDVTRQCGHTAYAAWLALEN
jgi:hypothetical protein